MTAKRKKRSPQVKAKFALEAIKQQKTVSEITGQYGVHATQVNTWKKQALEMIPEAFTGNAKRKRMEQEQQDLIERLYRQIGELVVERDWLKKTTKPVCS